MVELSVGKGRWGLGALLDSLLGPLLEAGLCPTRFGTYLRARRPPDRSSYSFKSAVNRDGVLSSFDELGEVPELPSRRASG